MQNRDLNIADIPTDNLINDLVPLLGISDITTTSLLNKHFHQVIKSNKQLIYKNRYQLIFGKETNETDWYQAFMRIPRLTRKLFILLEKHDPAWASHSQFISQHYLNDKKEIDFQKQVANLTICEWARDNLPNLYDAINNLEYLKTGSRTLFELLLQAKDFDFIIDFFKRLLKIGPDIIIHEQDHHKQTFLHWAAYFGNTEIIELLYKAGADFNAKNKKGLTPLYHAVRSPFATKQAITLLIKNGAEVIHSLDNKNITPAHHARIHAANPNLLVHQFNKQQTKESDHPARRNMP